jgi:hypothetical protein
MKPEYRKTCKTREELPVLRGRRNATPRSPKLSDQQLVTNRKSLREGEGLFRLPEVS